MSDNLNIREVPFSRIKEQIADPRLKIYGVSQFYTEPETAEIVEETLVPFSYNDIRDLTHQRVRTNKTDPYLRLGADNLYPRFLTDLISKAPTHGKAFRAACTLAYGDGLSGNNDGGSDFLSWVRSKGLTNKKVKSIIQNSVAYGGAYVGLNFVPNISNQSGKKFLLDDIKVYPFEKMRVGKREDNGKYIGESIYNWFHPEFSIKSSINRKFLRGIPTYTGMSRVEEGDLFMVKSDRKSPYEKGNPIRNRNKYSLLISDESLNSSFYPSPVYESDGFYYSAYMESSLAAFDSAGLRNGLMAGYIVTVPLADTSRRDKDKFEKEKEKVKNLVKDKLQGAENNQRILVVMQDPNDKSQGVQISPIPHTNNSSMHKIIDQRKTENILGGWGVPDSRLIGRPPTTNTGFANQSEVLKTSEKIWYSLTIKPIISPIQDFFNETLKDIWLNETGQIESQAEIVFSPSIIFNEIPSDIVLFTDFTRNERRARFGATPLNEEDKVVLEQEIQTIDVDQNNADASLNYESRIADIENQISGLYSKLLEIIPDNISKDV